MIDADFTILLRLTPDDFSCQWETLWIEELFGS